MVGNLFIDGLLPPVSFLRRAFFSTVVTPRMNLPGMMSLRKLNVRTHLNHTCLGMGSLQYVFFQDKVFK